MSSNPYVHMVIEITDESTEVCGVYACIDKAIEHACELAEYAGLVRNQHLNYDFAWDSEASYPVVYIESQEIIQ